MEEERLAMCLADAGVLLSREGGLFQHDALTQPLSFATPCAGPVSFRAMPPFPVEAQILLLRLLHFRARFSPHRACPVSVSARCPS
jgi:hypothetical protein